jgi:hypothetical protein
MAKKRKRRRQARTPALEPIGTPSPLEAVRDKRIAFASTLAARSDRFSQLLTKAFESEPPEGGHMLASTSLSDAERAEIQTLLPAAETQLRSEYEGHVDAIRALLGEVEIFSVLAPLMAVNLFSFWGEYFEPTYEGMEVKVELLVGLAASRVRVASRTATDAEVQAVFNHLEAAILASRLWNLAGELQGGARPSSDARFLLRARTLLVRGDSYPHHAEDLAREIYGGLSDWMLAHLGFTVQDVIGVGSAAIELIEAKYNRHLGEMRDLGAAIEAMTSEDPPRIESEPHAREAEEAVAERFFAGLQGSAFVEALCFTEGELAQQLPEYRRRSIQPILDSLSLDLNAGRPELDYDGLLDVSPLASRPFVQSSGRITLPIPGRLARDYTPLLEPHFTTLSSFPSHRARVVERLGIEHVAKMLPGCSQYQSLYYPNASGDRTECDGLVVFGDQVFVVEAKGSRLSQQAVRGDTQRLKADIRRGIREAFDQALRVRTYIESHVDAPFYDDAGSEVVEIRSGDVSDIHILNPTLHAYPFVSVALSGLRRQGLFNQETSPLSIFVNDLRIMSETIRNPIELLAFLRWRRELPLGEQVFADDELDIFSTFLLRDRLTDLLEEESVVSLGNASTDFDNFYLGELGSGPRSQRPRMFHTRASRSFCERLAQRRPNGWIDAGSAVLFLTLRELAFVDARLAVMVGGARRGEAVWQKMDKCCLVGLGDGLVWEDAYRDLPEAAASSRFVVFGEKGPRGPRIAWALDRGLGT